MELAVPCGSESTPRDPESDQEEATPQPDTTDKSSETRPKKTRIFCGFCSATTMPNQMNKHILVNHAKERKVAAILARKLPSDERYELLTKLHLRGHRAGAARMRKRTRRKRNYCCYCDKSVSQDLLEHLLGEHSDRPDVVDLMVEPDETKKHEVYLKLQKRGARRCANKRLQKKQERRAAALKDCRRRRRPGWSKGLRLTLRQMENDEVTRVVRRDPTALEYGRVLLDRGATTEAAGERLREVGRLLGCIRKHGDAAALSLKAAMTPEKFPAVQAAIRDLAGYDASDGSYERPELAESLRATLGACAAACRAACRRRVEELKKAADFYDRFSEVSVISEAIVKRRTVP